MLMAFIKKSVPTASVGAGRASIQGLLPQRVSAQFRQHTALAAVAERMATSEGSRLAEVPQAPPDPILGVSEAFKNDTNDLKLNLGVGAYRTEEIKPYVLNVVQKAEKKLIGQGNKEYLPIQGLAAFNKATAELLLGFDSEVAKQGRVATLQALSGTGSLKVGAVFIQKFLPGTTVYLSNPTWGNHRNIFTDSGVEWKNYRYYDPKTIGLDFEGMTEDLRSAPEGSVVVLHGCAHNPTGIDPTKEQWSQIADLVKEKNLFPFFDVAYQGFASGSLDQDAYAPRFFVDQGIEIFVAQSYSKNLGLYAERVGAINFIGKDKETATKVLSQMKRIARAVWSNPPVHGAAIAAEVVGDSSLFKEWNEEMEMMAGRIKTVRQKLYDEISKINKDRDWSFILKQIGMFSFTGLTPEQVENMTNKHHIYMTKDGRISLAGLPSSKAEYLAKAIDDSVRNVKSKL